MGAGQSLAQEMRMALHAIAGKTGAHDQPFNTVLGDEQSLSVGNVVRRLRT